MNFVDPDNLHVVGIFPNYATALNAWRGTSQSRVDEADWKYVIVHLHRLFEPDNHRKKTTAKSKPSKKKKKKKT